MGSVPFVKMNGAGNDFVVIDARARPVVLTPDQVRRLADRANSVTKGCDQLIVVEPSSEADVFMRIYNADGSEVDACGNATRCVARLVWEGSHNRQVTIKTAVDVLKASVLGNYTAAESDEIGLPADPNRDFYVEVDMGEPRLESWQIPVAEECDTLHMPISEGKLTDPVGVSMGNPHAVFFVADVEAVDLATLGSKLEYSPFFPERANIGIAQILGKDEDGEDRIRLRVWERGAGETPACGTGACAALVAAARRGLTDRRAKIYLKGDMLRVEWDDNNRVILFGPAEHEFEGRCDL